MYGEYATLTPEQMADIPALPVLIPLVSFELSTLPNLNEVLYMSPLARQGAVRGSRNLGYKCGLSAARALHIRVAAQRIEKKAAIKGVAMRDIAIERATFPITDYKIFTILNVWFEQGKKDPQRGNRKRDVYNPVVKSFIDGLTDAGLWVDDNSEYHTDFWVRYRGLESKGRFVLAFYGYE